MAADIKEIKYTIWLDEYKSFGEESHVFNNKDNWAELMQSNAALNDSTISATAFNFLIENDIDPLTAMGNVYGTGINFRDYESFDDVIANQTEYEKILKHTVLFGLVMQYAPYRTAFLAKTEFLRNIINNPELDAYLMAHSAFSSYLESVQEVTSTTSKTTGLYYLVSVSCAGRNFSYRYNGTRIDDYAGNSGASYMATDGSAVTLREARQGRGYANGGSDDTSGFQTQEYAVNKLVKQINLVSQRVETMYYSSGQSTYTNMDATAKYKVISE